MKFFVAFAAIVAVASANSMINPVPSNILEELQVIAQAIHNPSTKPETVNLLQSLWAHILEAIPTPVSVGPAIVEEPVQPSPVLPIMPIFPVQDPVQPVQPSPVLPIMPVFPVQDPVQPVQPVQPSPVIVGPIAPGQPAPLVQIIVNINSADNAAQPVLPEPVAEPAAPVQPIPVMPIFPISPEGPIDQVIVAEQPPVEVDPVIVGTPVIPSPVITLPDILN